MGKLRWYKRDPNAALVGMRILTCLERGAYNTVLDLIYAHDGKVIDDDRYLAGECALDVRVWRKIKIRLVALGKVYVAAGHLQNLRADSEVVSGLQRVELARNAGQASGRKRADVICKNNDLAATEIATSVEPTTSTTTPTVREERKKDSPSLRSDDDWPSDFREQFWSRYPRKAGKAAALRKLEHVRKQGHVDFSALIVGVERYAVAARNIELQFVKHPATWLNAGCWDDEPAALVRSTGPPGRDMQPSFREIAQNLRSQIETPPAEYHEANEPSADRRELFDGPYIHGGPADR